MDMDIYQLLDGLETFEVEVGGQRTVVRRTMPDGWNVYVDENLIGSFVRKREDRATYFESEVASEPGVTDWVSDDITTLISRMITVA
jgi:hypothetical protein